MEIDALRTFIADARAGKVRLSLPRKPEDINVFNTEFYTVKATTLANQIEKVLDSLQEK